MGKITKTASDAKNSISSQRGPRAQRVEPETEEAVLPVETDAVEILKDLPGSNKRPAKGVSPKPNNRERT